MFDDEISNMIFKGSLVLAFTILISGILCLCNHLPKEIKDKNCVYYNEQVYCIKEEVNENN